MKSNEQLNSYSLKFDDGEYTFGVEKLCAVGSFSDQSFSIGKIDVISSVPPYEVVLIDTEMNRDAAIKRMENLMDDLIVKSKDSTAIPFIRSSIH